MRMVLILGVRLILSLTLPEYVWLFSPWYLKLWPAALFPDEKRPHVLALIDCVLSWLLIVISRLTGTVQVSSASVASVLPLPLFIRLPIDFAVCWGLWWIVLWLINRAEGRWWLPTLLVLLITFLSGILRYLPAIYLPQLFWPRLAYVGLFFFVLGWGMRRDS